MSKYQLLADHLTLQNESAVMLTFTEIEAIIGGALPTSALTSYAWWTDAGHARVRLWRAQGWRTRLKIRMRCVHFTRDPEELHR